MLPTPAGKMVKHYRRYFLQNIFHAVSMAAEWTPSQIHARQHCDSTKDIPYHPDGVVEHSLDIHKPKIAKPSFPILIYIHGGGFSICSKDTHEHVALSYANQGYLVFNLNYRLAPQHRFPSALEDVCCAYEWVVKNAERYSGDIHRIVVAGESAGANLALALTISCCYRRTESYAQRAWNTGVVPKAAQILCGCLQISNPVRYESILAAARKRSLFDVYLRPFWNQFQFEIIQDVAAAYIGLPTDRLAPGCELADPLVLLESDAKPDRSLPAVFAMAGTDDPLLEDTRRLEAALKKKNAINEVRYYEGEEHVFHFLNWRSQSLTFWDDCWRFLKQYVA